MLPDTIAIEVINLFISFIILHSVALLSEAVRATERHPAGLFILVLEFGNYCLGLKILELSKTS